MVWHFIGVYIIKRILHGRLDKQNFSSRVEKNISLVLFTALTHEIFFNTRREISYLCTAVWYPLFMSIINYFIWLDYHYEIQFARTKHNKHVTLLLKKLSYCPLHVPPHNGHLSTTTTFICPQGGLCGEVGLYSNPCCF